MTAGGRDQTPGKKRRSRKRGRVILGIILLAAVVWLGLYLRSDAFREWVLRKVVAQLELMTGGKVEIQSFDWKLFQLRFEAKGLAIHGRESANEAPLIHVDRAAGQFKIISFFRREIGLRSLVMEHPVIHLVLYPDGTTSQPMPKISGQASGSGQSGIPRLFDLAVNRVEINRAELFLNDARIPFEFSGNNLSAGMSYSKAADAYEGNFNMELAAARYQGMEPLHGPLGLQFVMHPTQLEIKSFKFATDHSVLEAGGVLANYLHPEAHLQYHASLDLPEVGHIAKIPELEGGRLDLQGNADYLNQRYQAQGTLAGRHMTWRDADWTFADVDADSPFFFTPEKISLPSLKAGALGGKAQGEFEVVNWNQIKAERGVIRLQISGFQASQLAAAISTRRLPLNKINLAGIVSGDASSTWAGSLKDAVAQLKLEVNPPAHPSAKQLPVKGNFQGAYHRATEILDVAALNLATRDIRLNATGTLGSSKAQLKVAFNANDVREVQPVLAAWSSDARVPLDVYGRASFNGAVSGKFTAISARGRLDLENFDTLLGPIHTLVAQKNPAQRIHWDSMVTDFVLTPASVEAQNGILRRGAGQLNFSGSVSLENGVFNPAVSVFSANLQVQNANITDVQSLTGFNYPLMGTVNATVLASGTLQNLRGTGSLSASKLTVYGEPFTQFRSNVIFAGQETQFNNIVLSHNGAQLTGSAAVNVLANSFRLDLNGSTLELANFSRLEPRRFAMRGRAEFHASGSGTPDAPVVNAQLNVHELSVNGEVVGDLPPRLKLAATTCCCAQAPGFKTPFSILTATCACAATFRPR